MHTHQCGVTVFGNVPDYGCGYKWTHSRDENKTLAQDHMCPNCNCGPWYFIINESKNNV